MYGDQRIATIIAIVGMNASNSYAHGVQGAGQYFVNHANLASYYNELAANTNTLFLTVPEGRRFILTGIIRRSVDNAGLKIKENDAVKTHLVLPADASWHFNFATGIPFESGTSVYVQTERVDYVTLIGYFADLP